MLSKSEDEFMKGFEYWNERGHEPTFQEVVQLCPNPASQYWRRVSQSLVNKGVLLKRGFKYVLAPQTFGAEGTPLFNEAVLKELAKKNLLIETTLAVFKYQQESIFALRKAISNIISVDELQEWATVLVILYFVLRDKDKVPTINVDQRGDDVTYIDTLNDLAETLRKIKVTPDETH